MCACVCVNVKYKTGCFDACRHWRNKRARKNVIRAGFADYTARLVEFIEKNDHKNRSVWIYWSLSNIIV